MKTVTCSDCGQSASLNAGEVQDWQNRHLSYHGERGDNAAEITFDTE